MGKRLLAVLFAAALIAAGCGDDDDASSGDGAAELRLSTSDMGEILVDADGKTLYLFVPDNKGDSTCYDACEASWPIVAERWK